MGSRGLDFWRLLVLAGTAAAAALLMVQIGLIAARWEFYLYDFRAFYIGTSLFWNGQDAYDFSLLVERSAQLGLEPNDHPFIYHPLMLYIYRPITLLSYQAAALTWLSLLVVALAVTGWCSNRFFGTPTFVFLGLAAIGLNGSAAAALRSGQMSLLVTALLSLALVFLLRGRIGLSALMLLAAALPKLWPTPLIGVLLVRPTWQRALTALLTIAGLIALLLLGRWAQPESYMRFAGIALEFGTHQGVAGAQDGSSRNFLTITGRLVGLPVGRTVWVVWVAVVSAVSCLAFFHKFAGPEWFRIKVAIATLGLILVLPRVIIYQWVVILPTLAYVIATANRSWLIIALPLALYPGLYVNRYLFGIDLHEQSESLLILTGFTPLMTCLVAWLWAVRQIFGSPRDTLNEP